MVVHSGAQTVQASLKTAEHTNPRIISLSLNDTLKRDNLNPYDRANVLEQLCDCTKYYRRHESGC